jgi:tripartite-type tricarboxylate transporter receptor subunit TctC
VKTIHAFAVGATLLVGAQWANAQDALPNKTFRIIIPFVAGTGLDIQTRPMADKLATRIGRTVIVDNKPGAGHVAAANEIMHATPDGTTMVVSTTTMAVRSGIANPPYDIRKDMDHIVMRGEGPFILYVNPSLPVKTPKELADYALANPGKLNFSTIGPGSSTHFAAINFALMSGAKFESIHYKGSAPAITATIAGETQASFDQIGLVRAQAQGGRARMLAVSGLRRWPDLPDLPTMDESGFKGFNNIFWMGFSTTKGTPRGTINALNAAFNEIYKDPTIIDMAFKAGTVMIGGTPEQMQKSVEAEVAQWQRLIKAGNVVIE